MCLRQGTEEEGRKLGGEPAIRFSQLLELSGIPLQQPELLKWRHWRPGKIREMEPTTQRALELHKRGKWAERLLAHFAPFAEHITYMQDILGEDFCKEALDLLGDNRFRTLRQHCRSTRVSGREASR